MALLDIQGFLAIKSEVSGRSYSRSSIKPVSCMASLISPLRTSEIHGGSKRRGKEGCRMIYQFESRDLGVIKTK